MDKNTPPEYIFTCVTYLGPQATTENVQRCVLAVQNVEKATAQYVEALKQALNMK